MKVGLYNVEVGQYNVPVGQYNVKLGLYDEHLACYNDLPCSDLGCVFAGGLASGIYPTNSADACK